ncbi:MAG: AsmA-like C-terminal domain-containing protein [Deltaproteobacteria bacterium]|nr:AsmA-like C-terminal domain-containing protein [Deltaproteobacteria bacterium]
MNTKSRKTIAIILIAVVVFISAAAAVVVVLIKLSNLDARKGDIITALNKKLNRQVSYDSGDFSYYLGPTFTFRGVTIKEKNSPETFATIERITFRLAVLPLLWKKIVFKEVLLERPVGMLHRDHKGIFNINDLLEDQKEPLSVEIESIVVNRGAITFTDQWIIPSGLTTSVDEIDLKTGLPARGKSVDLTVSASIIQEGKTGTISLAGEFGLSGKDEPLANSSVDARITAANLSIERYRPYYQKYIPFLKMEGILNMDTRLKGNPYGFSSKGSVNVKSMNVHYPEVFRSALTSKDVNLDYTITRSPSEIVMDTLKLTVDDVTISGSCIIKDIDKDDPLIIATASSSPIALEKFGHFIPYGIMSPGLADFIETRIKGGTYELKESRLEGRISQIAHMEKDDNCNVLSVKAGVDKGLLTYGKKAPVFNGVKGELELRGKDIILRNMTAHFGESPMTLEGRITDYCLEIPAQYPFTMTMTAGPKEIAWLLGRDGDNKFVSTGESTLQMTGSGTLNNYTLDGRWDLSEASYSFPDIFIKPASQANRLALKANFKKDTMHIESFSYRLASLTVAGTGFYDMKGSRLTSFTINSSPFQVEDFSANLPRIKAYQPRGRIQASLAGDGLPKSFADLRWRGTIQFSDISFKPTETAKTISKLSGSVSLRKNRLDTSPLTGYLGSSLIEGRVTLTDFKNPSISVTASSALLDLEDCGLRSPSGAIKLSDFAGNIVFKDNGLQIKRLSARVNKSVFNVTGVIPDVKRPFFDIHVSSPYLDMDDVLLLSTISIPKKEESTKEKPTSEELSLKASVHSDKGTISQISYSKLRTTFTYRQGSFDIPACEMNAFGGSFSAKGRVEKPPGGSTRYRVAFDINKMVSEQVFTYAGAETVLITGTMTVKGDVTAEGTTMFDVKKTAQGTATLTTEKGSLYKITYLSKVFSILNTSQLLKFQLPDIVNDGMPYNLITGTFSLKDGILSTNDLFVNSDSLNMSVVGTTNIIREELDVTIGIQPFQTVDKVVSRIPVVGWILTSDTKALITLFFQAHGNRNNPTVDVFPVKSMEKGVLNIFKKLFQLPEKLITDTGEVIMGK